MESHAGVARGADFRCLAPGAFDQGARPRRDDAQGDRPVWRPASGVDRLAAAGPHAPAAGNSSLQQRQKAPVRRPVPVTSMADAVPCRMPSKPNIAAPTPVAPEETPFKSERA